MYFYPYNMNTCSPFTAFFEPSFPLDNVETFTMQWTLILVSETVENQHCHGGKGVEGENCPKGFDLCCK